MKTWSCTPEGLSVQHCSEMGRRIIAESNFEAGAVALREVPLMTWVCGEVTNEDVFNLLMQRPELFVDHGEVGLAIALRKSAAVSAWGATSFDVQSLILKETQTCFSDPSSPLASAVAAVAATISGNVASSHEVLTSAVINSFAFMPDGAEALFRYGSYFEHSCCPNCAYAPELVGGTWYGVWRTLRPAAPGQHLTISYIEKDLLTKTADERRRGLRMQQSFDCLCMMCVDDLKIESGLEPPHNSIVGRDPTCLSVKVLPRSGGGQVVLCYPGEGVLVEASSAKLRFIRCDASHEVDIHGIPERARRRRDHIEVTILPY